MTSTHPIHEPTLNRAHWVYAHPGPSRLNKELRRAGMAEAAQHYDLTISDLYAQGFNPALGPKDTGTGTVIGTGTGTGADSGASTANSVTPGLVELTDRAYARGEVPSEVRYEQDMLAESELLILQFPLWWYGPPAMLKGWVDRVLQSGFAQGDMDPHTGLPLRYGDGRLARRRALIIVTAGDDERTLGPRGVSGDINSLLFSLTHGALWYVGIEALDLHVVYDADNLDQQGRTREAERLVRRIRALDDEERHPYRRLRDGDYIAALRALDPSILPGRTDLGIHLSTTKDPR